MTGIKNLKNTVSEAKVTTNNLPTKIIFLDIDGVLNCERTVLSQSGRGYHYLDPVVIGMIRALVDTVEAKIVVSSTWRLSGSFEVVDKLTVAGFHTMDFHFDAITPILKDAIGFRGNEIIQWLNKHPEVTHYICIDDDNDFHADQNHIKVCGRDGFSADNYHEALKLLTV